MVCYPRPGPGVCAVTLRDLITARIRTQGPISVADYMAECLMHPTLGYYSTRDPLGEKGDFITAPEITQMFGELIGLSLAQAWMDQDRPAAFTLAELGPGRGTLMVDILRATRSVPGFNEAASVALVETSATLRDIQAGILSAAAPIWHDSVDTLPQTPLFLVANEFFDALPLRQFQRDGKQWRERQVGLSGSELAIGLAPPTAQPALKRRLDDTSDGDLVEHCEPAVLIANTISARIARHGGAALIIDYGDWRSLGNTLQAVRGHAYSDILANPGQADLTAHVDFEPLATAAGAAGCAYSRLTPQGVFLERLGITARAQSLADGLTGDDYRAITQAHRRLTHPGEMGTLFKTLGLFPSGAPAPGGLNP